MEEGHQKPGLKRFFEKLTSLCFQQLRIDNLAAIDYVSSLLARFACTDQLYRVKDAQGKRLEYIIDLMGEANNALDLQNERFSPFRERSVRQHIGDYTLFMTGLFRDFVAKNASLQYYVNQGKISYSTVSKFDRLAESQRASLFQNLSDRFEDYSEALDYMKKVHFRDDSLLGPYRVAIQGLDDF